MRRGVFLDRDGVLVRAVIRNGKPHPPASLEEMEMLPGVAQALATLRNAGFRLIMVTNQPDVARGKIGRDTVEAMNARLRTDLGLDATLVCYHDDHDGCECRKPKPGMLMEAAGQFGLDLKASYMVGDRWRDIEAGRRAGCATVFVDWGYDEKLVGEPDCRVRDLAEAAEWILGKTEMA